MKNTNNDEHLIKTLKVLLTIDDIEIIKCVIESIIEDLEEKNGFSKKEED